MTKALTLGILSSLFFAFTFILNRSMNLTGGYWMWSSSLRYLFTLPIMLLLVLRQKSLQKVLTAIKKAPLKWLLWSTIGFGMFYHPLTLASVYGESWFVAATWQITIVAGIFLTPLFGKPIPKKNLICSCVILCGIFFLQTGSISSTGKSNIAAALALILIAAISYPLGNRKMMTICPPELNTIDRVFGMTLCSMPFWLLVSVIAAGTHGAPSGVQAVQALIVALFSGVIATLLFFEATRQVRNNMKQLAVVEATQSGEVLFTILGGILFLGDALPSPLGFLGIAVIVAGMIGNSLVSGQ